MFSNFIFREYFVTLLWSKQNLFGHFICPSSTGGLFMHRDKFFRQINGVTMGSPLGPSLANLFMSHTKFKLFDDNLFCSPELYLRYVDDIFTVFAQVASICDFLQILNTQHFTLQFTFEKGIDSLPFLDTCV